MNTYHFSEMNLTWDFTFPLKAYNQNRAKQAIPVSVGEKFPNLNISNESLVSSLSSNRFSTTQVRHLASNKPLVISFLSEGWNQYAFEHLQKLRASYQEIVALGGELVVIVQGQTKEVQEFASYFQIPFQLVADPTHTIATQLGLYDEEFPVWESVAGISENVTIPAVYTIGRNGKIVYAAIDKHFDNPFSITEMLASVYGASNNIPVAIRQEMAA